MNAISLSEIDHNIPYYMLADLIEENDVSTHGVLLAKKLREFGEPGKMALLTSRDYGVCSCDGVLFPELYRRNTAYIDDELNYSYACEHCQQLDNENMQYMWDEYNASRL